jgi:hypothetical protein
MKRTKSQKIKASERRVNSQLAYKFEGSYNLASEKKVAYITEKNAHLASIKKELFKSLIIASLILISLMVIYWVQK